MRDLSIIIVSWNVRQLLRGCITSIYQSLADSAQEGRSINTDIWVADNASRDGTAEMVVERFPDVHLLTNDDNLGFAGGNNQAIEAALRSNPRYLLLLNPDTVVRGRALEELVTFMDRHPSAGMAGARLVYGDGSFQHCAFHFPGLAQIVIDLLPVPGRFHESKMNGRYPCDAYRPDAPPFEVDHPLGASMLVRRDALDGVGLMDTGFFMYCEEIDWAMRMRAAGWKIYCVPAAEIVHYAGQSTAQIKVDSFVNLWRSRYQLYVKHYSPSKARWAGRLVDLGLRYQSRKIESMELLAAYAKVRAIWRGELD